MPGLNLDHAPVSFHNEARPILVSFVYALKLPPAIGMLLCRAIGDPRLRSVDPAVRLFSTFIFALRTHMKPCVPYALDPPLCASRAIAQSPCHCSWRSESNLGLLCALLLTPAKSVLVRRLSTSRPGHARKMVADSVRHEVRGSSDGTLMSLSLSDRAPSPLRFSPLSSHVAAETLAGMP